MLNLNCVICAELFTPSSDVHVTTCGHLFHYVCLKQWMERSKSCPQCRNKCTDRNIFRVYFNLANLDISRIDVGSLQEQLDDSNLKLKLKEQEFVKLEENVKSLRETQKQCMRVIDGLERKLQQANSVTRSYDEQIKLLKADARISDDLRKEVSSLKSQIETLESVSTILTATKSDVDKMVQNETDPQKLALWATTYKRELRISENKRSELRNVLKVVQNDLRKEVQLKRIQEERVASLESDNYRLNEKIKVLESKSNANNVINVDNVLPDPRKLPNRISISPSIKENVKKIEEADSPYLNIKSSSVGLVPLFKRNQKPAPKPISDTNTKSTTTKIATLQLLTGETSSTSSGAIRKTSTDLGQKYSIFKKPRISSAANAKMPVDFHKQCSSKFVFNGFGGSEKVDPFISLDSDDDESKNDGGDKNCGRGKKLFPTSNQVTVSKTSSSSVNSRLKAGNLRNFKASK